MKSKFQSFWRGDIAVLVLAVGFAISSGFPASAANPVVNGNFENALVFGGTTNWEVVYVAGCPGDFAVKGRITEARNGPTGYGGSLRPLNDGLIHAYFKQTVSGLTANGVYAITNWMCFPGDPDDAWHPKIHIFMETVGGLGSVATDDVTNNSYQQFVLTNTAKANGEIEIRLHFNKDGYTGGLPPKWNYMHSWYDDVSMGLVSAPVTNPPYRILSFTLLEQTATWTWESVSNQLYSIQASPDLSSWSTFHSNLLATGTSLSFTTNVSLLNPQFFRIHQP
jgi:hypothetical protein